MNTPLLVLSPKLRINKDFPYAYELRRAKDWLRRHGITQVKPVYHIKS